MKLTANRLRELLDYDPTTGVFTWRIPRCGRRHPVGSVAGSALRTYWYIKLDGVRYLAHRLAWLYMHDEWPSGEIDHIDTVGLHNWISNLRVVTHSQNQQNRNVALVHSKSKILGVSWHKRQRRWVAAVQVNGRQVHHSYHDTKEEAHLAYLEAKARCHPFAAFVFNDGLDP